MDWKKVSGWLFLLGIVIAIIAGLIFGAAEAGKIEKNADLQGGLEVVLGLIGLIAGVLAIMGLGTVTEKEMPMFMMAVIIIIALSAVTTL